MSGQPSSSSCSVSLRFLSRVVTSYGGLYRVAVERRVSGEGSVTTARLVKDKKRGEGMDGSGGVL